jgi:predicted metalloprotease with PDZ domain
MTFVGAAISILAALGLSSAPVSTDYTVTPHFTSGALDELEVTISLHGNADGRTVLDLPDGGMGRRDRWKYLSDLRVTGAAVQDDGPAKRILNAKPNALITVQYRVRSAYGNDPKGEDGNPFAGAVVLPTWFTTLGDFIFAAPEGRDHSLATFNWGAAPQGWTLASDLDRTSADVPLTVADVVNSTMLGGSDVQLYSRHIPGGDLRVAIRGQWSFADQKLVDDIAAVVSAQRHFWGDAQGPYFVSIIPLATSPTTLSVGGTGKFRGFALYGTSNAEESRLRRILAHEHTHNWIPSEQGLMPEGPQEPSDYWYSEGFTDFYTDRTLLRAGIWTPADFVAHLNEVLREYDNSPVRTAPNDRIISDFWTNPDVQKLAYERGYLLAFLWDEKMRRATEDRVGLDQVMFAMRDRYRHSAESARPDLIENFESTSRERTGVDVRDDIQRFAIEGEPIMLPENLFGPCANIGTVSVPSYDIGFDPAASAKAGVFTGVEPTGPAYRAGLRDGMRRIARSGGNPGDSQVEITYRVLDAAGAEHLIRYKPEGASVVRFQQASLLPRNGPGPGCAARLGGA